MVLWRPIRLSRTNTKKRCPFHHRGLECKSRKSRHIWNYMQVDLEVQNEARQRLTELSQKNMPVIANTLFQQLKETILHMDITRWSIPKSDWLCSLKSKMEKMYTVSKNKTWSWLGSDHELLIAKFRLKLKKVRKTVRPFRYDLNQIPYDYRVEVMNKFKGLDLYWEFLKNRGSQHFTGSRDKNHLKEKEMQEGKVVFWGGFTNSWGKKGSERQRIQGKIYSIECRVPENSKET